MIITSFLFLSFLKLKHTLNRSLLSSVALVRLIHSMVGDLTEAAEAGLVVEGSLSIGFLVGVYYAVDVINGRKPRLNGGVAWLRAEQDRGVSVCLWGWFCFL